MSDSTLETVEVATADSVSLAVVWLHGLGADGHDFVPIVRELALPFGARFVFPHAPARPVTINAGLVMRAWFDLLSLDRDAPVDEAGIRASARAVERLIERERSRGFDADRIVVAGFSQGGAIALHVALRYPERLAGALGLSTYLPLPETLAQEHSDASRGLPIWLGHGTDDPIIDIGLAEASKAEIEAAGYAVDWHRYAMGHGVCPAEIADIGAWLTRIGR